MTAVDPDGRIRHPLDVFHSTFNPDGTNVAAGWVPVADGLGQVDYLDSATLGSTDAVDINIADAGGYFTATDVEAALQELAKKDVGYTAHGNTGSTETFDALTGWHSATLDANSTFTFTGATSGLVAAMVLELTQDGTGSRLVTWPGAVVWSGGSAPTLSTTAGAVDILSVFSRDGGTTWYGFPTGGGTNLTGVDFLVGTASGLLSGEIVVGTTPGGELGGTWASPTVDATHAGSTHIALSSATPLVESGAGSAGSGTAASKDDHVHPAAAGGSSQHILLADGHATPFAFTDLLQMDDGSDFMWSDS